MDSQSSIPIAKNDLVAPTPQNTPLTSAPLAAGLSRPTVPDITEDQEEGEEDDAGDESATLPPGAKAFMLDMVEGKLAGLMGRSSGYIENLPVEIKRNVAALKGVQVQQDELHHKFKLECLELEKKYLALATPLYERRHSIITGTSKPTLAEIASGEEVSAKDTEDYEPLPKIEEAQLSSEGIPEFWLTALRNHIPLSEIITDRDAEALKHLVDIKISYPQEYPGFKISFYFEKNAFFEQDVLEKTYVYAEEVGYEGDFIFEKAIGTDIKWKEDKDLTKEFEIRKQRNKNTNRTRLVRKAKPTESFFNFFTPPVPIDEDETDLDPEDIEELDERIEMDYQIGEDFKEKIVPKAIDFFTGKILEYEVDDDDDYEDTDDEDDEEEDGEDDDEDSDEDEAPRRKKITSKKIAAAGEQVNGEDCKQQ